MAEEGGVKCGLAVRMAVGEEAFDQGQIEDELLDPLQEQMREQMRQSANPDKKAALGAAEAALMKQKFKAAMEASKFEYKQATSLQRAKPDLTARYKGIGNAQKAMRSKTQGTEHGAYSSALSTESKALSGVKDRIAKLQTALDAMPGLQKRLSNMWTLQGEKGLSRKIANEIARIMGNTSIEATKDPAVTHAAQCFKTALDDLWRDLNEAGAIIPKLPGYFGRQMHDALKVQGGFWANQRAFIEQQKSALRRSGVTDPLAIARAINWDDARYLARRAAFQAWRGVIEPLLHDSTFDKIAWADLAPRDIDGAEVRKVSPELGEVDEKEAGLRERALADAQRHAEAGFLQSPQDLRGLFLLRCFEHIVDGRAELSGPLAEMDFVPRGGKSRAIAKARVLQFKSPDAWIDYAQKYSKGNIYANIVGQVQRGARTISMLDDFGPDPERGFAEQVKFLHELARTDKPGIETGLYARGGGFNSAIRVPFDAVTGLANVPVSLEMAQLFKVLRASMVITKMGSVPLSKPVDAAYMPQALMRQGASVAEAHKYLAIGTADLATKEGRMAAKAMGAGVSHWAGQMLAGSIADDSKPGWSSYLTQQMYRISGFSKMNEGVQGVVVRAMQAFYGDLTPHAFEDLPRSVQATFLRHAITPEEWDMVRQGIEPMEESPGQRFLTMNNLHDRVAADPHLGRDARVAEEKFQVLIHGAMHLAVNEPGARELSVARAPGSLFGASGPALRPGTVEGEIIHSLFQFKNFVFSTFGRHFIGGLQSGRPVTMLTHLLLTTLVTGYISNTLKQLARGEAPTNPQDIADNQNISLPEAYGRIFSSSLAQGGGLGLLGDFFLGEMDRNGAEFDLGSLAGPLGSQAEQVLKIIHQAVTGGAVNSVTGRSEIPSELTNLAFQNLPMVNLWYTRLAIDYLFKWQIQEALSPGSMQRYQDRQEKKNAVRYWGPSPTSPSPYAALLGQ